MASVVFEEQVGIPLGLRTLADFRRWALSDAFPERGRIDFIAGQIEVDMSPENAFCHGTLKSELTRVIGNLLAENRFGYLFTDRMRLSSPAAGLSVEPDVMVVCHAALADGRVRLMPAASAEPGNYIELEGAADLVVEIVSDSSVAKDTKRLPEAYFRAGVREFWLADARGDSLAFQIHRPGDAGYEPAPADAEGYQPSAVLGRAFRLDRQRDHLGNWTFDLRVR
jgi:Uma2 family endonuclease